MKHRRLIQATSMLVLSTVVPPPVSGQTVRGRVVDAQSGTAISQAAVHLVALDGEAVAEVLSSDSGRFELEAPRSGHFHLLVQRIGYVETRTNPIRLVSLATAEVEIRISAHAISLEPLEVKAEALKPSLDRVGFYTRQREGLGAFIDEADIEARGALRTIDLFHGIPGIRIVSNGRSQQIVLRGGIGSSFASPYCGPRVYLDGIVVDPFSFDRDIRPGDLEGIEVYRSPAQVPAQFGGAGSACGVVLLWTRK